MTNEDWLKSVNTERLADILTKIYRKGKIDFLNDFYERETEDFVEWLKEPHEEVVK